MTRTGETIGPYTLGDCLGQGSFGAVYEATHQETGQRVALKFLRDCKQLQPDAQNRFVREVALLQRLDHENIVRHYDAGLHDGSIYCAMELVECGSLKEVLAQRQQLPWRESVEVAVQVCRALAHAHARGCVHRDLKPANLYLSEDGRVKLGDLGLARDFEKPRLTVSGQTVGTWRYMSPEQIVGDADIDGRLDLYALGCILFEMVAGRVPFDGENFAVIFDQHLEAVPPRLDQVVPDCPRPLADLVEHTLEKTLGRRPENATVVAERLEQVLAETPVGEPFQGSTHAGEGDVPQDSQSEQPNLTQRLHREAGAVEQHMQWSAWALVVGAVVLVLALVLALRG